MTERLTGWEPLPSSDWPAIADAMPRPWPLEAAAHDLRWHAARTRLTGRKFPGRDWLAGRWGWSGWDTRTLLSRQDWQDRLHDSASVPPAFRQPAASVPPAVERTNANNQPDSASVPPAFRQPAASVPPRARFPSHRSQNTEHRSEGERAPDPDPLPPAPIPEVLPERPPRTPPREPEIPPEAADWVALLQHEPDGADIAVRLFRAGVTTLPELRALSVDRLQFKRGIGPDRAEQIQRALRLRGLDLAQPQPRAGAPPGPSNKQAAAEADRQRRTREMLAKPDPFDPFNPTSKALIREN